MKELKLYMILLGCKPTGRNTEQHDLFFGIGRSLNVVKDDIIDFWKEAMGKIHIDAWREVRGVDHFKIEIIDRSDVVSPPKEKLFFINLGGYKQNEFEEFHYKMLTVATDKGTAIQKAKRTAFYKHTGFKGATSHIDAKYGIDVDEIYEIEDILPLHLKEKYSIRLTKTLENVEDEVHLGYLKIEML